MMMLIKTLAIVAVGTVLATSAFAQSAREIRGGSPYVAIEGSPTAKDPSGSTTLMPFINGTGH
jgi:hypothetical protein